jgi:hypothetical protein
LERAQRIDDKHVANYNTPDSSIRQKMVTKPLSKRLRNSGSQILAAILLALVLHGATAGLTHNHGRTSLPRAGASQLTNTPAVTGSTSASSPAKASNCECLICQLQHNLSITLLTRVPQLELGGVSATVPTLASSSYVAELLQQSHGRAPPLSFLL